MTRLSRFILPFLVVHLLLAFPASAEGSVARAVLFYSPACGHCHKVMTQDLPKWFETDGEAPEVLHIPPSPDEEGLGPAVIGYRGKALYILVVNTFTALGGELYDATVDRFEIPPDQRWIPMLIVGDTVLVGGADIPNQFPGIVSEGLEAGGIDWPDIAGLSEAVRAMVPSQTQESPSPEPVPEAPFTLSAVVDRIMLDPAGNLLSIAILAGMVASVVVLATRLRKRPRGRPDRRALWAIPLLSLVGILVAGYLAYVETTHTIAVCGPVGDCNAVQQSEYAMLGGIIPVGSLGLFGYIAILLAWILARLQLARLSDLAAVAISAMTTGGVLFSIYLTFLEPFVIGATCAWCLASAIMITAQMWLSVDPALQALARLKRGGGSATRR